MTLIYTQTKECINKLEREGFKKLLRDFGEEVVKTAFECGVSPRELQAIGRWLKEITYCNNSIEGKWKQTA